MQKVIVTADNAGNIIVPSKTNPAWGWIRVEQTRRTVDDKNFARTKTISALIQGEIKDLKGFGYKAGQEIPGRIITIESLEPFNKKEPERDYKIAGKTGICCAVDGQPIYSKNFYKEDATAKDEPLVDEHGNRIRHNNTAAIKAAYAALKEEGTTADLGQA